MGKYSALDFKYSDLSTTDAIRQCERDNLLYELNSKLNNRENINTTPTYNFNSNYSTSYSILDTIDIDRMSSSDYIKVCEMDDELQDLYIERKNLKNLCDSKPYVLYFCLPCFTIIWGVVALAISEDFTSIFLPLMVTLILPVLFSTYNKIRNKKYKTKLKMLEKQIKGLENKIIKIDKRYNKK